MEQIFYTKNVHRYKQLSIKTLTAYKNLTLFSSYRILSQEKEHMLLLASSCGGLSYLRWLITTKYINVIVYGKQL